MSIHIHLHPQNTESHAEACARASAFYYERHHIQPVELPHTFAGAHQAHLLLGCFGITYGAQTERLTTEWYLPEKHLSATLNQGKLIKRHDIAEIGTRVINKQRVLGSRLCFDLSIALTAQLVMHAAERNIKYLIFTGDRSATLIARKLHMQLTKLGAPCLATRSETYQKKWQSYFAIPRQCYGIDVSQAITGSQTYAAALQDSSQYSFTPTSEALLLAA